MSIQKIAIFVFCSSGVIIFPNPTNLGYYLSKLSVTKAFDHFSNRYNQYGFRFKSVILGPMHSIMLRNSRPPGFIVGLLRKITTGNIDEAASKIISFIETPKKRMYYLKSSAIILWVARILQNILPLSKRFYQAPSDHNPHSNKK